ncbi:hypothetical protein N0V85_003327 [Neurospora sp. IMI 360204]|nr:hypothetical protein N0V85_003327 [Neurospora sp. IMI 360204]
MCDHVNMENPEPPDDRAGTAKPVQDPKDNLEVHRARYFPPYLRADNPSSSRPDQSTYLGTSTNVNVIPQTKVQSVEEIEEVEEDECPGLEGDIPDLEPKASTRFAKVFQIITAKIEYSEASKRDRKLIKAEAMAIPNTRPKEVKVINEQLRINRARAAFEAAELRAQLRAQKERRKQWELVQKERKLWKWWAKQLPRIPGNSKDWKLLSRGQLDGILAYCAKERKQFEKVQKKLEEDMEKQRRILGEKMEWRIRIRYRLPDGTSGKLTMRKFLAFYALNLRALDERERELKKLREEKEKDEKDEEKGEDLDTNTNTNNAQHTQANKMDEMVPEPDSETPHNSRPKELKLGVMIPDTNDDRSTATWKVPPLYAARLCVLKKLTKRLDEGRPECRGCPTIHLEINHFIRMWQFHAYWPDYANFWPELYAYILGCFSYGANSDIDASSSNDTRCLRLGQAIHGDGETPRPDSTTVPYPGPLRVSHEYPHRFFRAADEVEKWLNAEKKMRESEKAKNEEEEEEEENDDDDDDDDDDEDEEEEEDEEEQEDDGEDLDEEEDKEEGEEEEWEDPDDLSSCKAGSDINGMEVSSSDIDDLGHGQAITPKPDSTTVPDPRTAEQVYLQEYRMTFFAIPDMNVAMARIASERLRIEKERASLTRTARYLEEVKKELGWEKEEEELKKEELKREEKKEEDEGEDPRRNHPEPTRARHLIGSGHPDGGGEIIQSL